jgi:hypothetical protein
MMEGRDLGFLLAHITVSTPEMANKTGLNVPGPKEDSDRPDTAIAIHDEFKNSAEALLKEVSEKWKDEDLLTKVDMYGEQWGKREYSLHSDNTSGTFTEDK